VDIKDKLAILADAAKYDASCASSAAPKRNSLGSKGIGSTEGAGICHSYAPDGRSASPTQRRSASSGGCFSTISFLRAIG